MGQESAILKFMVIWRVGTFWAIGTQAPASFPLYVWLLRACTDSTDDDGDDDYDDDDDDEKIV